MLNIKLLIRYQEIIYNMSTIQINILKKMNLRTMKPNHSKSQFQKFMNNLDLYGQSVVLRFQQEERYHTSIGISVSITIMGAMAVLFISMTIDMMNHQNPSIVSKVEANPNPEKFSFLPDSFFLAIGVGDQSTMPVVNTSDKVYYVAFAEFCHQENKIDHQSGTSVWTQECVTIDMVQCSESMAMTDPSLLKDFSKERLNFAVCLNKTTWEANAEKAYLNGLGSTSSFGTFSLTLNKCDKTEQTNCATDELKNGFVQIMFTETLLDQGKPGNPYTRVPKTTTSSFMPGLQTYVKYLFRHSYFDTLDNFFYLWPKEDQYHTLSLISEVESSMVGENRIFYTVFLLDDKTERYSRTYLTIFTVFGQVVGFQGFLIHLFGFLVAPLTRTFQKVSLMSQLFSGPLEADISRNLTDSNKVIVTTTTGRNEQILKPPSKQKSPATHTCKEYFRYLFGCPTKTRLKEGIEQVDEYLDISIILQKLFELERLKAILLNGNQKILFDYIPNKSRRTTKSSQIVPLNEEGSMKDLDGIPQQFDRKLYQAKNAYQSLRNSLNLEDQNFVCMIDPHFRELFETMDEQPIQNDGPDLPGGNLLPKGTGPDLETRRENVLAYMNLPSPKQQD